jgi:hypothetical protein
MKLYNLSEAKGTLLNQLSKIEQASEQASFIYEAYSVRYAIDKLSIDNINMIISDEPRFTFFVDEEQLSKINLMTKIKTGLDLDYNKCRAYEIEESRIFSHPVSKADDLKSVVKKFKCLDIVSQAIAEQENERQIKKEKNLEIQNRLGNVDTNSVLNKRIMSIDFEFDPNDKAEPFVFSNVTEIGYTILDQGKMISNHFIVEENKRAERKMNIQSSFLFGDSYPIKIKDIENLLKDVLKDVDVVVFHSYAAEMKFLDNHDIDISDKEIYDTQLVFKNFFDDNNPNTKKLSHMLKHFDIEYGFLHNAGNDAYQTMNVFHKMITSLNQPEKKRKLIQSFA